MLHIPPINLLLLAAKQEPYKKSLSLNEKHWKNFWEKFMKMDQQEGKKSNRIGQKNKRVDRKVESNDSHEISDRGENIRHPRPPFPWPWIQVDLFSTIICCSGHTLHMAKWTHYTRCSGHTLQVLQYTYTVSGDSLHLSHTCLNPRQSQLPFLP